ncbi:hypothetical protein NX059_008555 [Plenodomus lindquistii]|nr:hypothetical protein NX059_008555 [Plenodomus lindquistii]
MPPHESHELRRGKYSRIDAPAEDDHIETPTRFSTDTTGTLEDLEEHDPLAFDSRIRRKKSAGDLKIRKASFKPDAEAAESTPQARRTRRCAPGRCCCWLLVFLAATVLILATGGIWAWKRSAPKDGLSPPWYPSPRGGTDKDWEESYNKAAELVKQMTLPEKVNVTSGTGWSMDLCVGNNGAVPRLQFHSLCLQDGPLGIRFADNITAFPAGITVGATFSKEIMYLRGRALGAEAAAKGVNVLLGPAMGPLGRMPAGGRNWEGFGSDPVLQGIAAAQTIKGIQEQGVMATAKHFVGNEQEHFRQAWEWGIPNAISSNIDDRTLHEIYAWPFADSVRAGVTSVMCSYNQVNSSYACQNSKLLNGILKDELGFQGFVQSDWLAQRGGVASALAGLDMTMPGDGLRWAKGDSLWGAELTKAVLNGSVPIERVDDMVTRVVASWYQVKQDQWENDGPNFSSWTNDRIGRLHQGSPSDNSMGVVNQYVNAQGEGKDAHGLLVRRIGAEGTVLLKNEGKILPLDRKGWKQNSKTKRRTKYRVGIFGEDSRLPHAGINHCDDQSCNEGTLASGWGSGAANYSYLIEPLSAIRDAFDNETVYVTDWPENKLPDTKEILEDQDLCIVFANADAGEGFEQFERIRGDRNDLFLQRGSDQLIQDVAAGCGEGMGDVIVVIHAAGPVIMENFIDIMNVKAVLLANLPGTESGNAITDVLFGDVEPSGRLPYTIGKTEDDYGPGSKIKYLPAPSDGLSPQQDFKEGLYIDYRHFDKQDITPRFEFGFGLSYTDFHLSSLLIQGKGKKTPLPAPRPVGLAPPSYPTDLPDPNTALFPEGFHKVERYIYPWLESVSDIKTPQAPSEAQESSLPSAAGGGPGGNPDLYTTLFTVSTSLTNTGPRDGYAVVQLYLSFPQNYTDHETGTPVDFPVKVLRGFEKVFLKAGGQDHGSGGERKEVKFEVTRRDLSYWDVGRQNWVLPQGAFGVGVGWSSRNLVLQGQW